MLMKDMKSVSGSLNLAVSVLYVTLEVSVDCTKSCTLPHMQGISTTCVCLCVCLRQDFLQRAGLDAELLDFCLKFGLDLLLLMTISFTDSQEPIRELAVYSHNTTCRDEVLSEYVTWQKRLAVMLHDNCSPLQASQYLEQARNQTLDLCPISSPHLHLRAYRQGNHLHLCSLIMFLKVTVCWPRLLLVKPISNISEPIRFTVKFKCL